MKKPILLRTAVIVLVMGALLLTFRRDLYSRFENEHKEWENEEEEEESGVEKQLAMWFQARAYPDPTYLDDKYMKGWREAQDLRNKMLTRGSGAGQSGLWNSIGPSNNIGGRILCIAIDPTNSNILFAGSASGGIWKSVNGGSSWSPVTTNLPTLGVATIVIDPNNVNVLYAGTGEVYRIDSTGANPNPGNTGNNVWKTRGTYGIGIIKSIDGGLNWTQVLTKSNSELFAIQTLRIDPSNSNIVYACATDGLYRSTNAGSSWTKIFNVTYVTDVVMNGSTIVCAAGNLGNTVKGIFKSTDNGTTWVKITSGLPASFQGFIKFGWVPADVNHIVASIGVSTTASVELYNSTNFGTNWTGLSTSDHTEYQYWCAHDVAINPVNTNRLTYAGVNVYQYNISASSPGSVSGSIHSDIHDIQYDPSNSNNMYICCDGGIYKSTNAQAATPSFTSINSGLAATQFYASLGVSRKNANRIIGGLQDNGVVMYNGTSWSTKSWVGGDGAACAIDPVNDDNMLANRDARAINLSTDGGVSGTGVANYWGTVADSRTAFVAPMAYSPSNPSIVYCGTDNLHKSTNGGGSWSGNSYSTATNYIEALHKTAITLAVSPTNPNKVYVSTSSFAQFDNNADGLFYTGAPGVLKTTTGNTPFTTIKGSGANTLPNRYVMDFAISTTNDDSVFAAIGGFGTQHIYITGDGGLNWEPWGIGLPDVPFNAVLIDPVNPKVIYAGGDLGMYVSPDRGAHWYDFNTGFWDATQIVDLQYAADFTLIAATHGKGVFRGARYSGILPVNIISFTGQAVDANNKLEWKIEQQVAVSHFELERKSEAGTFIKIADIPLTSDLDYLFNDTNTGINSFYYRLKSVNADGSFQYSTVIYIRRNANGKMIVMGNPFKSQLDIQFNIIRSAISEIRLYDAGGKLLKQDQIKLPSGQNLYTMHDLQHFPPGTYFIEANINGQLLKQKVLKQ